MTVNLRYPLLEPCKKNQKIAPVWYFPGKSCLALVNYLKDNGKPENP
jgi:hypothetical protein